MTPPQLILVPTEKERQYLKALAPELETELCGFGLVTSGIITARLLASRSPTSVILVGIAGAYPANSSAWQTSDFEQCHRTIGGQRLEIGRAYMFHQVRMWGIGVGEGHGHQAAESLGWCLPTGLQSPLTLCVPKHIEAADTAGLMLSVTAASAGHDESQSKKMAVPLAVAEDMEGYAVALACQLQSIPLTIIRGITNQVGDRTMENWRWESALRAAAELLRTAWHEAPGKPL